MTDLEQVESLLKDIQRIATARLRACNDAAKKVNLVLVDKDRLECLERLLKAAREAFVSAEMTRDYKDVIERGKTHYSGKKWLLDRTLGGEVYRAIGAMAPISGPTGCMIDEE